VEEMIMVKMPPKVLEKFTDLNTIKFLATVDDEGKPNVVYILSMIAIDPETLAFADLALNKTKKNLLSNGKCAVSVLANKEIQYQVKGKFIGFQTSGPLYDMFNEVPQLKYNAYFRPSAIGLIKVEEVYLGSIVPMPGKRIA
jgi:predicted pyridoxine 5'-phosphate oxidase superfamily flavin-nucleotide-binding protein